MTVPVIYIYDIDGLFLGERPAQPDPAHEGRYLTDVLGGTCTPPPDSADEDLIPYWTGADWEFRESPKGQENRKEAERQAEIEAEKRARLRDPAARKAELANIRWERQSAGIIVDGINLRTDRESILDLRAIAGRDAAVYPLSYKADSGWVSLASADMAERLANAQDAHIQACFDREAVLAGMIDALATDPEALADLDLSEGWP